MSRPEMRREIDRRGGGPLPTWHPVEHYLTARAPRLIHRLAERLRHQHLTVTDTVQRNSGAAPAGSTAGVSELLPAAFASAITLRTTTATSVSLGCGSESEQGCRQSNIRCRTLAGRGDTASYPRNSRQRPDSACSRRPAA